MQANFFLDVAGRIVNTNYSRSENNNKYVSKTDASLGGAQHGKEESY